MKIRPEHPDDYAAILRLTYKAFLTLDYPGRRRMDEHYLIHLLRGSPFVIPELSFVAEQDGEIIGHILYTKSEIQRPNKATTATITFGPLSVLPEHHRRGIGAALVRHSMEKAGEMGFGAVLITGVPDYYPKLGFRRARDYGLTLSDGTADDSFMAYELMPGYLGGGGMLRFLPPEFEQAEKDDAGFAAFHKQFMAEYCPAQLILRPLFDGDIVLMERWLYMPHVAEWYKHPDHWLNELRERRGEFSFLTHFIAEYEGVPIGFCQYYDTYFAQEHEVWNDDPGVGEKQGEIFSIDYLIGEPDYLRRGFGKEMIAQMLAMLRKIGAKTVIVEPERDNTASNRSLEANGFIRIGGDYHLELGDVKKIILETERLILREMTQEDYPALAVILLDEQTMYAYEGAFTESETQAWLDKNLARYRDDGMGLWAVILKDSGLMIGQAGLTWQEINGGRVPEVGYLFNRAYWGKGYAVEAAIACKNYGFSRLGFDEIYSIVRDTNIASMNVAIRNGMVIRERFTKHYRGVDMPHYAFAAKKGS